MKSENKPTWKDVVKEALAEIGASGHLDDIYSKIKGHPKEEKSSGIWYLREEKPIEGFDPIKNPNPGHEDVQGMLPEPGRIYGYETSAAINDAKKKFMNMLIEEVATIKEFQRGIFHPKVVEIVSHIDVLWFGGDTDMLVPEFAFEIEHTTDVTKGLGRLLDLHRSGQRTRLFVILPVDKISRFDKEIGRRLFRDINEFAGQGVARQALCTGEGT